MFLDDFDYLLPPELVAQHPTEKREGSRLMVMDRSARSISVDRFPAIVDAFSPGDLLILNNTRVIPARLLGHKASGGKVEIFLVSRLEGPQECWSCLIRSSKTPREGTIVYLDGGLRAEVLPGGIAPNRLLRFDAGERSFADVLQEVGRMPLPPYIRREVDPQDRERYQTVFARREGAVAAPTAGLHFTEAILESLRQRGVQIADLTLHVGLGTFLPVRVENISEHRMHEEYYDIPQETVDAVRRARSAGRRVFALGTTTTRALEHAARDGELRSGEGFSDLFISPGFRFQVVDALITNFHLPKSTLLMLVSALAGREFVLEGYRRAIEERFRFFSYGDCMLIK